MEKVFINIVEIFDFKNKKDPISRLDLNQFRFSIKIDENS
jgi:hypothetical protein